MGFVFDLRAGDYSVFRDADAIFEVVFEEADKVVDVVRQVEPVYVDDKRHDTASQEALVTASPPSSTESSRDTALAEALKRAMANPPEAGSGNTESASPTTKASPASKINKPHVASVEKVAVTEDVKEKLLNEIAIIQVLI
ncbi:MAG: hypothetical protein CUN55_18800, partial [Phototrophicales bacterium]